MHAENVPDVAQLAQVWPLSSDLTLRRVPSGINNRSWYVTASGDTYVLRVYQPGAEPARIAREHAVLGALDRTSLSFRVPQLLPTRGGETFTRIGIDDDGSYAALFSLIPGRRPEHGSPEAVRLGGAALGELDAAMEDLDLPSVPSGAPDPDSILTAPDVPDYRALPERLALDGECASRLVRVLDAASESAPKLYRSLPQQWIHADFAAANLLLDEDVITGVLDFEFAHMDLRAVDLAWALCLFGFDLEMRADLELMDAFGAAYCRALPLTEAERRALPALIRLSRSIVAVHWCGRHVNGTGTREMALGNVENVLRQEAWLAEHGDHLIDRALRWPVAEW